MVYIFCHLSHKVAGVEILLCTIKGVRNMEDHLIFTCISSSRSGDSTARIWTIADGGCGSGMQNEPANVAVLKHFKGRANEKSKDVTTLDWNVSYHVL